MDDFFLAILSVKGSDEGIKTQNHIKSVLNIEVPVYYFDKAKKPANAVDKIHSCQHSHIKLAEMGKKSNKKYSLIFEDDSRFYNDIDSKKIFFQTIKDLKNINFDIIHLGSEPKLPIFKKKNYIYRTPYSNTAHSIIYSNKGRDKLISYKNKIPKNSKEDNLKYHNGSLNQIDVIYLPFMKSYTLYPPITYQSKCPKFFKNGCDHSKMVLIYNKINYYATYWISFILLVSILNIKLKNKKLNNIIYFGIYTVISYILIILISIFVSYDFFSSLI